MTDYPGAGGYFTDSDIGGTNPHGHEIHALFPAGPAPHVWEQQPYDPFASSGRLLYEQALIDGNADRGMLYAGYNPYTGQRIWPESEQANHIITQEQLDRLWELDHPIRARFSRWLSR